MFKLVTRRSLDTGAMEGANEGANEGVREGVDEGFSVVGVRVG